MQHDVDVWCLYPQTGNSCRTEACLLPYLGCDNMHMFELRGVSMLEGCIGDQLGEDLVAESCSWVCKNERPVVRCSLDFDHSGRLGIAGHLSACWMSESCGRYGSAAVDIVCQAEAVQAGSLSSIVLGVSGELLLSTLPTSTPQSATTMLAPAIRVALASVLAGVGPDMVDVVGIEAAAPDSAMQQPEALTVRFVVVAEPAQAGAAASSLSEVAAHRLEAIMNTHLLVSAAAVQVQVVRVSAEVLRMPVDGEALAAEEIFEDMLRLHELANQHLAEAMADLNATRQELGQAALIDVNTSDVNRTALAAIQATHASAAQRLWEVVASHADLQRSFDDALAARTATRRDIARARAVDVASAQRLANALAELNQASTASQEQQQRVEEATAAQRLAKQELLAATAAHNSTVAMVGRAQRSQEAAELQLAGLATTLTGVREDLWLATTAHNSTRAELERVRLDLAAERWRHGRTRETLRREVEAHGSTHKALNSEQAARQEAQQAFGFTLGVCIVLLMSLCCAVVALLRCGGKTRSRLVLGEGPAAPVVVVGRPIAAFPPPPPTVCTAPCPGRSPSDGTASLWPLENPPPLPPGISAVPVQGFALEGGSGRLSLGDGFRQSERSALRSAAQGQAFQEGGLPGEILT